jgi:Flp pilus assembly protein TadD
MSGIPDGDYTIMVRGANGGEITSQNVSVRGDSGSVNIRLPESAAPTSSSKEASVSMYQLSHKVVKGAKKEFDKAARAGDDNAGAIAHLQKAIEIDPEYVEALNNLGSRFIQIHQFDKALGVLTRAQKLDPASALVQTNLAVVLLAMRQNSDAERAARRAYQLASSDPRARYVLALSLYNQQDFGEETLKLLQASRAHFPNANIALAAVYAYNGKTKEARNLLTGYLASGHQDREPQVRQMLATLGK